MVKKKRKIKYKAVRRLFLILVLINAFIILGAVYLSSNGKVDKPEKKNNNIVDTNTDVDKPNTNVEDDKDEDTPVTEKTYYTDVIRNQNTVIVYKMDENGEYSKIVKVFPCSVGANDGTPTGTFTTTDKYEWRALFGGVYGQYATRINGSILFHSVPYTSQSKDSLEWEEYNKLGTAASMGCVRMRVEDVKWIYDNCPSGMKVRIFDGDLPEGIEKPTANKIDSNSPNKGWDPTDPDPENPWKK